MTAESTLQNILLVDDHPLLLEGLGRLINAAPGLRTCGMAKNVRQALDMVENLAPQLVITDLTLPGRNGLELIKDLASIRPGMPVIVLSMHDEMIYAERVLRAGGSGYVMKDTPPECLLEAIKTVLAGGVYASRKVTSHLLGSLSGGKPRKRSGFALDCLTDREIEVFDLIGRAMSNHEIATSLGISPRTVDAHRAHIREKLGLADGGELTRHAIRWIEAGTVGPH
jgi:DNA-binding NarL/FixJ family response regulator